MAYTDMVPQTAAGTSWVSPNNALLDDSAYARYPQGGSANVLKLTNLTNRSLAGDREIVGFDIRVDAWSEPLTGQLGRAARVTRADIDEITELAPDAHDGSLSTYYGDASAPGPDVYLTVIHDLGTSQSVGHIKTTYEYGVSGTNLTWEYSDDGFNWTTVPRSFIPFGFGGAPVTDDFDVDGGPVTARYWRFTIDDDDYTRLYNFRLYASSGGAERVAVTQSDSIRIEVAITKDGTTAAGDWTAITLTGTADTYTVGGASNLLGATVSQSEVSASTFGVLIRRADALSGENTTTWRAVDFAQLTVYHNPAGGSLMPDRPSELQLCLLGKETTKGTAVTPTIRLKASPVSFQPNDSQVEIAYQGDRLPGDVYTAQEASEGAMEGHPTYDEIGVHLASLIGIPETTSLGSGAYRHEFVLDSLAVANPQTYTHEKGDQNVAERAVYAIATGLQLTAKRSENSLSGRYIARGLADNSGVAGGTNQVWTLTMGTATTQKLRFKGATTAAITTAGLNAAGVQSALEALSTIGSGNVSVSGSGPFVITAASALAGLPLPNIEVHSYSGGTTPSVALTTYGGYTEYACEPIQPGHWSVYYASTYAGLSAAKLAMLFDFELKAENAQAPVWVMDAAETSWQKTTEAPMKIMASFTVQADSTAAAIRADRQARTQKFARFEAVGPVIGGGFYNTLTIEMSVKVHSDKPFKDEDGAIFARGFELMARNETTTNGWAAKFVLINSVASY